MLISFRSRKDAPYLLVSVTRIEMLLETGGGGGRVIFIYLFILVTYMDLCWGAGVPLYLSARKAGVHFPLKSLLGFQVAPWKLCKRGCPKTAF